MDRLNQKHSQAAVFYSSDNPIRLQQLDIPQLKHREILVRNEYTTLCRSDLNTFTGKRCEKSPTILGHEIVGRIVAFGAKAPSQDLRGNPLEIGDRVTWSIYASNPDSPLSRMGIPQKGDLHGGRRVPRDRAFPGSGSALISSRKNGARVC